MKYKQGKKMFVSDALSRLYIKLEHDVIPPNFLQDLKTSHICHNLNTLHKPHTNIEKKASIDGS